MPLVTSPKNTSSITVRQPNFCTEQDFTVPYKAEYKRKQALAPSKRYRMLLDQVLYRLVFEYKDWMSIDWSPGIGKEKIKCSGAHPTS